MCQCAFWCGMVFCWSHDEVFSVIGKGFVSQSLWSSVLCDIKLCSMLIPLWPSVQCDIKICSVDLIVTKCFLCCYQSHCDPMFSVIWKGVLHEVIMTKCSLRFEKMVRVAGNATKYLSEILKKCVLRSLWPDVLCDVGVRWRHCNQVLSVTKKVLIEVVIVTKCSLWCQCVLKAL